MNIPICIPIWRDRKVVEIIRREEIKDKGEKMNKTKSRLALDINETIIKKLSNTIGKRKEYQKRIYIFMVAGIFTIIIGAAMIHEILNPPVPVPVTSTNLIMFALISFILLLGFSFVIHGFHPILLVKQK